MKFRLIIPEKVVFEADISSVTIPTDSGEITILPQHVSLTSVLAPGEMTVRSSKEHIFAVASGFVMVTADQVDVLAEAADHADEIDLQKAEEARARAERLREAAQSEMEIAEATAALERALAQIKVANRKRRHHARTP